MQFKSSFELRNVCGEQVLIANGIENIDFGALVHLNPTAADIFTHFSGKDFTIDEVVAYITSEYEIDAETARHDVEALIVNLDKNGIIK